MIRAGGGDDTVVAEGGDDRVDGDAGDATLYGRDGDDAVFGGTSEDRIFLGMGNDVSSWTAENGTSDMFGDDFVRDGALGYRQLWFEPLARGCWQRLLVRRRRSKRFGSKRNRS